MAPAMPRLPRKNGQLVAVGWEGEEEEGEGGRAGATTRGLHAPPAGNCLLPAGTNVEGRHAFLMIIMVAVPGWRL
jgi:hypothetical protein